MDKELRTITEKYFPEREIVGPLKYHKGYFYYLCTDGILYKTSDDLKTETPVYKGINYLSDNTYTDTYMVIE